MCFSQIVGEHGKIYKHHLKHPFQKWPAMLSYQIWVSKVIQSDLMIPDRRRSPTTFERVTNHHPKKVTQNCPVYLLKYVRLSCLTFLDFQNKTCHLGRRFCFTPFSFTSWRQETNLWVRHTTAIASTFGKWTTGTYSHHPFRKTDDLNQTDRIMFPPLTFRGVTIKDRHPDLCLKKTTKWKHKHI